MMPVFRGITSWRTLVCSSGWLSMREQDKKETERRGHNMNNIIYLIGLIVVVIIILRFLGLL